jgi:hypothetical protein
MVEILAAGAHAAHVSAAAMHAAERGLRAAADDPAVLEAVWLLVRIPLAARGPDFAAGLRELGLTVPNASELLHVAIAYSAAVDERAAAGRNRTDLAEMAQLAGVETINTRVGPRAASLFGTGPDEVKAVFAGLATVARFGEFARRFFAAFAFRVLDYFVCRALPDQTGPGRRFTERLRAHANESAVIVQQFSGEWFSKHRFETGGVIGRGETQDFLRYAIETKLTGELRRREGRRGA